MTVYCPALRPLGALTHAHVCTHTDTHIYAHACTHPHTCTHTHTHTHTKRIPLSQWTGLDLCERGEVEGSEVGEGLGVTDHPSGPLWGGRVLEKAFNRCGGWCVCS